MIHMMAHQGIVFSSLALTNRLATGSLYLSAKISKIVFVKVLKIFDLYNKTRSRMLGIDLNFESLRRYNPIVRFSPIIE